jgi:hypothetical protein
MVVNVIGLKKSARPLIFASFSGGLVYLSFATLVKLTTLAVTYMVKNTATVNAYNP